MIRLPIDVPVEPDADEAREWLVNELAKPAYQAAQPTLFDRVAQAVWDWITSLSFGGVEGPPALGLLVVVLLVAAAIVLGVLVFGLPRLNRRSRAVGALFGDEDERTAAELRRGAALAAGREDWPTAIAELYRAIARDLSERGVLTTSPGTTATGFARRAGELDPGAQSDYLTAAGSFDEVRYLDRPGTREQYEQIVALDHRARDLRPRAAVPA